MNKVDDFILGVQKKVGKVQRNAENDHLKSRYADIEGVLDLLNPFFIENNVLVDQSLSLVSDKWELVTTLTIDEDSKTWRMPLLGYDSKTPMQSLGSAISFARRYTLKNIFKLVDSDDDANAVTPTGEPSKPARKSEIEKMLRAFAALNAGKSDVEAIVKADAENFTASDMAALKTVYQSLKSGKKKLADFISEGDPSWQE